MDTCAYTLLYLWSHQVVLCVSDASDWVVKLGHTTESSAVGTPAQRRLQITPISYANPHWHKQASLKSTEFQSSVQERDSMHWKVVRQRKRVIKDEMEIMVEWRGWWERRREGGCSQQVLRPCQWEGKVSLIHFPAQQSQCTFLKSDWTRPCADLCDCKGCGGKGCFSPSLCWEKRLLLSPIPARQTEVPSLKKRESNFPRSR